VRPSRPIASIALFAGLSGCGGSQEPAPAAPAVVTTPSPGEREEAADVPSAEAEPRPHEAPESASDCEAYLALYQRCEPVLEPEIMAGNRRSYRAERAFIDYLKTTPEGAGVEQNCAELLRALRPICGA
jgi:hypothetical protein